MRFIDLSHTITSGMITYPGLPGPVIEEHLSFDESADYYATGTEFSIGRISLVANTGTYLDTPAHRYRDGHDLAGLPLGRCAQLPARVVDVPGHVIEPAALPDAGIAGTAVLLRTGWDRHWGTAHYGDPAHPHLTEAGARHLADRDVALVGIDSVNIDDTVEGHRPAHSILLGAGIPVVEHLTNLGELPTDGAVFTAVPPAIVGLGTFPVRAFATLPYTGVRPLDEDAVAEAHLGSRSVVISDAMSRPDQPSLPCWAMKRMRAGKSPKPCRATGTPRRVISLITTSAVGSSAPVRTRT